MNSEATYVERRKHSREGVIGELENITYSVLRKYGVASDCNRDTALAEPVGQ